MNSKHGVLDHGSVGLIAHTGGDHSVVNAARVSFGKQVHEMDTLSEGDIKLIGYLMREKHGTPFEHNFFSFRVKAPIFIFREWHRHRAGMSYNEMSGRYMELPAEWYIPDRESVVTRVGKPGHYEYEQAIALGMGSEVDMFIARLDKQCEDSYAYYKHALADGIAPEQARLFLHVNHYSEMIFSCNARSLMHFMSLRCAENAQWEIRQYANVLSEIFKECMPHTCEAWMMSDRVSP